MDQPELESAPGVELAGWVGPAIGTGRACRAVRLLWIAFNASHAMEIADRDHPCEQTAFLPFLRELVKLDETNARVESLNTPGISLGRSMCYA